MTSRLIFEALSGPRGSLILAGAALGAAAFIFGSAYRVESRPCRSRRQTLAAAVGLLWYAASRAVEPR